MSIVYHDIRYTSRWKASPFLRTVGCRFLQIVDYALEDIKNDCIFLLGNPLHHPSSHFTLQREDGVTFGFACVGQHQCCRVTIAPLNQPCLPGEPVQDVVELACLDEGLHSVEQVLSRNGARLVDTIEDLPLEPGEPCSLST